MMFAQECEINTLLFFPVLHSHLSICSGATQIGYFAVLTNELFWFSVLELSPSPIFTLAATALQPLLTWVRTTCKLASITQARHSRGHAKLPKVMGRGLTSTQFLCKLHC